MADSRCIVDNKGDSKDFVLPKTSETSIDPTDFQLVTWLILLPGS